MSNFGAFCIICLCFPSLQHVALSSPPDNYTVSGNSDELSSKFSERQRFEGLLAGGRTIAFPFAVGLILTEVSGEKENWNVSLRGLNEILDLSPDQLSTTYQDTLHLIKQDDNLTFSSHVYTLQNMKAVQWDNTTWNLMNLQLKERTKNLLSGKLVPKDSVVGSPFRFSTRAVVVSTFHYKNVWRNAWMDGNLGRFGNMENVPFLRSDGQVLFSEEEDFTAISIPLEGSKSIVFIQPKINLTLYLLKSKGKFLTSRVEEDSDFVPFPKNWKNRDLSVHVPLFNLTFTDQYGKELWELGMNQTFCTTLHDRKGNIPYYLRPIVQVNSVSMTENGLEIASATGTAVEKFYLGLDFGATGYPKTDFGPVTKSHKQKTTTTKFESDAELKIKPEPISPSSKSNLQQIIEEKFSGEEQSPTTLEAEIPPSTLAPREKFIFDRAFIWYLNDDKLGPLIYGVVDRLKTQVGSPEENSLLEEQVQQFLMWSCRSFKQSAGIDEITEENDRA